MIDLDIVQKYLKDDASFWCETDEERVELLSAMDELGYQWYSGNKLLSMNSSQYQVLDGISYTLIDGKVTKGRVHTDYMVPVSELMQYRSPRIDPSDLIEILSEEAI